MRALFRVLLIIAGIPLLAACAAQGASLATGQSYALAPDLTVRLSSARPALNQLRLQITVLATGGTAIESLLPAVVVIPAGGKQSSATLDMQRDSATITMLLDAAQSVNSVVVRDARDGHTATWAVGVQGLLACKPGDECQLLALPRTSPIGR